jgi:hypothetical protein
MHATMVAVADELSQCSLKCSAVAAKKMHVQNLSQPVKKLTPAVASCSLAESSRVVATPVAMKNQPAKMLADAA